MITELCPTCWLYHAPEADCRKANAMGQAWLVKPPVDDPKPIAPVDLVVAKRKYVRKPK